MGVVNEIFVIKDLEDKIISVAESETIAKQIIATLVYDRMVENDDDILVRFLDYVMECDDTLIGDFFINDLAEYDIVTYDLNGGL